MSLRRMAFATSCALLVYSGYSLDARAQNASNQAAAQALFDEARTLMNAGKFGEACPKFAESQRLDPGAGTLLNLANCYEKNGQIASAWVTFKDAAAAADVKHRSDWSTRARERAAALEPVLSRLTIVVPSEARVPGLEVRRDGVEVGGAEWGTAIPVDPGDHSIEVSAPKKNKWSTSLKLGAKSDNVTVTVPALIDEPIAKAPEPVTTPTTPPTPTTEPPPPRSGGSSLKTVGLVIGGIGIVGVGVGSIFGLSAVDKNNDSKKLCPDTRCTNPDGIKANDDAKSNATISTIAFAAGGAALVGGLVLFFTAPSGSHEGRADTRVRVTPLFASHGGGVSLGGAW